MKKATGVHGGGGLISSEPTTHRTATRASGRTAHSFAELRRKDAVVSACPQHRMTAHQAAQSAPPQLPSRSHMVAMPSPQPSSSGGGSCEQRLSEQLHSVASVDHA